MAVRQATASDLEELTRILIASSNDDPCYPYRFPWRDQYPVQYEEHCRRKCWEYISTNTVDVYESRREKKVVAFAVWEQPKGRRPKAKRSQTWPRWGILPSSHRADDGKEGRQQAGSRHQQPRDNTPHPNHLTRIQSHPKPFAREDRSQAFREASKDAKANLYDKQYPRGYMFLKILLCHPDYRRQGAGTELVKRGMALAHLQGVHTTLFSSPMGVHLYRKLGFREVARFEVAVEGDDDKLDIPAMVVPPPSPARSRRGSRCAVEAAPNGLRKCVTTNVMVVQKV
jgi:GNAT superfamily N-acetyltransferase